MYVAGIPRVNPIEISWFTPDGSRIRTGGRYTLQERNTYLLIENIVLRDIGTYRVDIRRLVNDGSFFGVTSTVLLSMAGNDEVGLARVSRFPLCSPKFVCRSV